MVHFQKKLLVNFFSEKRANWGWGVRGGFVKRAQFFWNPSLTCSHCCFVASLKVFKRDWIHQESIQRHLNEFRGGIAAFELLKQGEHFVAAGCEESPKKKKCASACHWKLFRSLHVMSILKGCQVWPSIALRSTRELNCGVLQYDQNQMKLTWYYLCPCCQQKSSRLPGLADAWSAKYEW